MFIKLKLIAVTILLILLFMSFAHPQSSTELPQEEKAKKRELKKEAALNLWRLKKSIEEEGFYAARVALNIWRSNAMDAGTFDQTKYDEFKKQMYEKSVSNSLKCFEFYLEELSFHDANMCLQTWKVHSQEIGIFDQTQYEELQEKLDKARTEKNLEQKKIKEASD
jgi:hypothetical protein